MLKKVLCLLFFQLFIIGAIAQAQVSITYATQGKHHFTMTIPDNWRVNVGSEEKQPEKDNETAARLITAVPGDGTALWFGMWVPQDVTNFKEAKEYLDALGIDLLSDVVTTKREFDTLNGMDVYYASGTGKREDESMDFRAAFVQLAADSVAIAIYIGPHETTVSHGDDLEQMFLSLKPISQKQGE